MSDPLYRLFADYDRGTISRRQLLQTLGVAAVAVPMARVLGQGACAGRAADTTAACNKTPMKAPFESTGFRTVLLDHFNMHVTDAEREAAFYVAFMNWKVRSNQDGVIDMDIGDLGSVRIRGGYVAPARGGRGGGGGGFGGGRPGGARGDTTGGRGAGAGGRGGGAARPDPLIAHHLPACDTPRFQSIQDAGALWDAFAWGIEPWDTNKVEAALKARGLDPVADHHGDDYRSFHVKDPDGMDVILTNGNKKNRRQGPANGKLNVDLPFEPTPWKTVYLDHISYQCTSYKETVAFYEALLGWKGLGDEGSQNETIINPEIGGLLIRSGLRGNAFAPGFVMPATRSAVMNHISFGISPFDPDVVYGELCKRGLRIQVDTGAVDSSPPPEHDIHTSTYKSYHTNTTNNYNLQFSAKTSANMKTGAG